MNNTQSGKKEERNKRDTEQTVPVVQNEVVDVDCIEDARKPEKRTNSRSGYNNTVLEFHGNSTVYKAGRVVLND